MEDFPLDKLLQMAEDSPELVDILWQLVEGELSPQQLARLISNDSSERAYVETQAAIRRYRNGY